MNLDEGASVAVQLVMKQAGIVNASNVVVVDRKGAAEGVVLLPFTNRDYTDGMFL